MKITNRYNLPQPLVAAIRANCYIKVGDVSATGLAKSPRQHWLEIRHWDEIEVDASDLIWSLMGTIGHKVLEHADMDNHITQERLHAHALGWTLTGEPDLYEPDGTLCDYKWTSVWAVKESKAEWEAQLNTYAWLYKRYGFDVKALRIVAILRDWSKPKAKREPDYPQVGVVVREVPLWSKQAQEDYIVNAISGLRFAECLPDDELPDCSPDERWQRPDMWAVKNKGTKRALRVFAGKASAVGFSEATARQTEIEFRPGESVKCESYCSVSQFCNQFKKMKGGK